jgi:hypothetical protein
VSVEANGLGGLRVRITARGGNLTNVRSVADSRVPVPNTLFDVPGGPTGATSLDINPGTPNFEFTLRPAVPGQAATAPLAIADGCGGTWSTLVGGGHGAFTGPGGAPSEVTVTRQD